MFYREDNMNNDLKKKPIIQYYSKNMKVGGSASSDSEHYIISREIRYPDGSVEYEKYDICPEPRWQPATKEEVLSGDPECLERVLDGLAYLDFIVSERYK